MADVDAIETIESQSIEDWLREFGAAGDIRIRLSRKEPLAHRGVKTNGLLSTYTEPISHEDIQQVYGGGKFQIEVSRARPNKKTGAINYVYAARRTFDIAGVPNIDALQSPEPDDVKVETPIAPPDTLGQQAMNMANQIARESRAEVTRLRDAVNTSRPDPAIVSMIDGLQTNIQALQELASKKDDRLLALMSAPKDDTQVRDLAQMLRDANHDHAQRIAELRTAQDSELRQLRLFNQQQLDQAEQRSARAFDAQAATHHRELASLRENKDFALQQLSQSYEMRISSLMESQSRAEREISELRTELAALRARKDQGPLDQIQSLVALKSGFDTLMPSRDEGASDDRSTIERVVTGIMDSPVAQGLAQRLAGSGQQPAAGEQLVAVRRADGHVVQIPARYVEQQRAQHAAAAQTADQGQPTVKLNAHEVKAALQYLEAAYRNQTDPRIVAASARNIVPGPILGVIREKGVDLFFSEIARLDDDSPFHTLLGRQYARKIAEYLINGENSSKVNGGAHAAGDASGAGAGPPAPDTSGVEPKAAPAGDGEDEDELADMLDDDELADIMA